MSRNQPSVNNKKNKKMKKNAMEFVNFEEEKRKDPKYKTELCKSWIKTQFCAYGNKCRFAHGKKELFDKDLSNNYKQKPCNSFKEHGICPYGSRCNFIHNGRKLSDIYLPYYFIKLFIKHDLKVMKRLKVFESLIETGSTRSNEDCNSTFTCSREQCNELDEMEFQLESMLSFMV